jgi:hypothetical protein
MKPVKNVLFTVLLVFAMAMSTPAGELDTPGAVPPPPPRQMATSTEDTTVAEGINTSDYVFLEAMTALLSVY